MAIVRALDDAGVEAIDVHRREATLDDVDRDVARAYGVSAPLVGTRRAAFVIDEEGIVRHRHVHALGLDFQDADDLADALDSLPARA